MSTDALDKFFDEFKDRFHQIVREIIAEEIEPLRALLVRPADGTAVETSGLVDAVTLASDVFKWDVSTPERAKAARQKIYYRARLGVIPSVKTGARAVMFDPEAVKRWIAAGGTLHVNREEPLSSDLRH